MANRHYGPPTTRKEINEVSTRPIDYFTKWVEAEVLATITEAKVQNFVWKNIICRFGIPKMIISENGHRFNSHGFRSFCANLSIKNKYSSSGHP